MDTTPTIAMDEPVPVNPPPIFDSPFLINIQAGLKNEEPSAPLLLVMSFRLPGDKIAHSGMEFPRGASPDDVAGRLQGLALAIHMASQQLAASKVAVPETGVLLP